eukprot:gene17534-13704_t
MRAMGLADDARSAALLREHGGELRRLSAAFDRGRARCGRPAACGMCAGER